MEVISFGKKSRNSNTEKAESHGDLLYHISLCSISHHLKSPCLFIVYCMPVQTLCNLMDCSPPGSSVHGIFQVRILK